MLGIDELKKTEFFNDFLNKDGLYWGVNLYAWHLRQTYGSDTWEWVFQVTVDGQRYGFEAITVEIDRSDLGLENGSSLVIEASEVGDMKDSDAENKGAQA